MITDEQRAGHALRVWSGKLVDAVVAEQFRAQPDLEARYGEAARAFCTRDVGYHFRFLAASVDAGRAARFVDYVAWAKHVLLAHGIPASDFLITLRAMRQAVDALLDAEAAEAARRHIDAALERYETLAPRARPGRVARHVGGPT